MFLPGVNNANHIPKWRLSKSYESLLFNFSDQVELRKAYSCIWSHFGGKAMTIAMRQVKNTPNNFTIVEVVFSSDKLSDYAFDKGIRYNNRILWPVFNVRSDVLYIAYPLFDLPLDSEDEIETMLYEEFAEPNDDIKGPPPRDQDWDNGNEGNGGANGYSNHDHKKATNGKGLNAQNGYDDEKDDDGDSYDDDGYQDDDDEEDKQGVVDVVLGVDDISGLYNGTATVIVRRILPPFMQKNKLVDQERLRHLLPNNVRVYHMYCRDCQTLDDHPDGECPQQ
ncbi:hypothetical protein BDB00DRAFT_803310 [Zychaea mexicana]|uniref:uncharacterized protein n=1 Tax=Zychaea mexicana TaxID=64656 RepID=UPI0022FEF900|nr:uncharacterized protein BDB00DRAFT_803310 [Zychaea mexicana]KAI9497596.1 hypothetical protein BDB00DRAFT_803310 [Zychaea mexicana]